MGEVGVRSWKLSLILLAEVQVRLCPYKERTHDGYSVKSGQERATDTGVVNGLECKREKEQGRRREELRLYTAVSK